mmetsp:Transcript_40030/g.126528  ORF Transcript_40030/g.126528 Transcript_40030/m.126528 type:complete len:258 (+) Transcript_40030:514-1287(+)
MPGGPAAVPHYPHRARVALPAVADKDLLLPLPQAAGGGRTLHRDDWLHSAAGGQAGRAHADHSDSGGARGWAQRDARVPGHQPAVEHAPLHRHEGVQGAHRRAVRLHRRDRPFAAARHTEPRDAAAGRRLLLPVHVAKGPKVGRDRAKVAAGHEGCGHAARRPVADSDPRRLAPRRDAAVVRALAEAEARPRGQRRLRVDARDVGLLDCRGAPQDQALCVAADPDRAVRGLAPDALGAGRRLGPRGRSLHLPLHLWR